MILSKPPLSFCLTDTPGGISLAEAFAGVSGRVHLGRGGVELWNPRSSPIKPGQEIICDMRGVPISEAVYLGFKEAAVQRFLPARVVLFAGQNPDKINEALKYFDYVLVPDTRIRNIPADFRKRILSYSKS